MPFTETSPAMRSRVPQCALTQTCSALNTGVGAVQHRWWGEVGGRGIHTSCLIKQINMKLPAPLFAIWNFNCRKEIKHPLSFITDSEEIRKCLALFEHMHVNKCVTLINIMKVLKAVNMIDFYLHVVSFEDNTDLKQLNCRSSHHRILLVFRAQSPSGWWQLTLDADQGSFLTSSRNFAYLSRKKRIAEQWPSEKDELCACLPSTICEHASIASNA